MADNSLVKSGFTVSPKTGTGNATLTIAGSERTGRVDADAVAFTATLDKFPSVSKSFKVVQKGKPEFIAISGDSTFSVAKEGGSITLKGVSNSSKLEFTCSRSGVFVGMYTANGALTYSGADIDGDPGATAQYEFFISVSLDANEYDYKDTVTVTATTESGQKVTWTLNQAASVFTYKLIPKASVSTISAAGGSSIISAVYETYRNGSKIHSTNVFPDCSIPTGTAFTLSGQTVSVSSRDTTAGDARSVTVTATYGSVAFDNLASSTVVVSQEKNEITNYGDVINNLGGFYAESTDPMATHVDNLTIDAANDNAFLFFLESEQTITYTSGATRAGQITKTKSVVTPCDGFHYNMEFSPDEIYLYAEKNESESKRGPFVVKIINTGEGGKSNSQTGTVYQTAGVKTYSNPVVTVKVKNDYSYSDIIPAYGGTCTPEVTYSQTWGWNGSTTGGGTLTTGGTVTYSNGTTDGTVSADSLGTTLKSKSTIATVTATVTMNGKSGSKDYTVYQAANTRDFQIQGTPSYSDIGANGSAAILSISDNAFLWFYDSTSIESITKSSVSVSYSVSWGGGSSYNNAKLNTSNGYVTADSLGTTAKDRKPLMGVDVTFSIDGQSEKQSYTISQKENKVESSTTTGGETIYNPVTAGSISNKTIPASGGSATATAGDGSQGWTINKKYRHDTYTSGSVADVLIADSSIGSDTIKPSVASISGSAESKGTTVSDVTTVKSQAVTWTGNGGKKATGTMYIYQEANAATSITYGTPSVSLSVSDIPASGGEISSGSVSYAQSRTQNYTSGSTTTLTQLNSGGTVTYSIAVSADSLGVTEKARTSIGTLTATVTMNGKSGFGSATVYQAANVASYGAVSVSVTTPVSIPAAGAIYNITPTMNQTVSYTSGSTRAGSVSASYAAKNTVTGFSLKGNTVTVQQNLATSARNGFIVTVTATGEGSKTAFKEVTFNQVGASPYLNVDPTTISFAADGSSTTFKIESNDSWTIS